MDLVDGFQSGWFALAIPAICQKCQPHFAAKEKSSEDESNLTPRW